MSDAAEAHGLPEGGGRLLLQLRSLGAVCAHEIFLENLEQLPEAVTFALVVGIARNHSQMKAHDVNLNFRKGFNQIGPLVQKLQPPVVGHIGERRGRSPQVCAPSSSMKNIIETSRFWL